MSESPPPSSRNTILIAGAVIGLYLAALISFSYIGQTHLRRAMLEQELLGLEKQATAVSHLLAVQQGMLDSLSASPEIKALLAAHDPGKPFSADTATVSGARKQLREILQHDGQTVLEKIALVGKNGHALLEVGDKDAHDAAETYPAFLARKPGRVHIEQGAGGYTLTQTSKVLHDGTPAGYLAAMVDVATAFKPLLTAGYGRSGSHRTALLGPRDEVLAAALDHDPDSWRIEARNSDGPLISVPVAGTGLHIVDLPHTAAAMVYLTSPLFLAALALIALPLLAGVAHLLRLNTHNLVLSTRFEATAQQREKLHRQNERLQSEIDRRVESEQQLAHQANYDQLTGLPNRSLALDRLTQAIKWAKRDGNSVLTMFLDLDRFKQVNDSLGHAAGDELLREAAQRLQSSVRDSDTVSRLGGDEFLVICPEMTEKADWQQCATQMLKVLSAPFYVGDHEFFVGASIGVASYPQGGTEPQKLLKNADIAMYAAKEKGRNRYCYYDPSMDAAAIEGVRLENNLRHALRRDELRLVFQPIIAIGSGRIVAAEALLRWTNKELGEIPPEKFIPVAEETGLIHEIGEWLLTEACHAIASIQPDHQFRIAINLSSKQFSRPGRLLECILSALRQSGLMPNQLELEITESILIDDRPEITELIGQLDRIGVRLSLDDFGTGYSALNYLQRFPFDVLKIDRSFTRQIPGSKANSSLIRAIIAMAHALELEVVAEGLETREQAGFLLVYHCEYGQGYLYSQPMPAEQLQIHLAGEQAIPA
ncbi:MAG: EAL domain-containing protein [Gammaproteobacteria bacterium]|nr:EAL domain-containing protein [Gammaproteobacteria bacterium]